jgi:hypothetical protein
MGFSPGTFDFKITMPETHAGTAVQLHDHVRWKLTEAMSPVPVTIPERDRAVTMEGDDWLPFAIFRKRRNYGFVCIFHLSTWRPPLL